MSSEEKLEDFEIKCLKCNSEDVVVLVEGCIDYGGQTGVQAGSVVIKCKGCGNAQTFYA
jgi:ribosomal protein S27E